MGRKRKRDDFSSSSDSSSDDSDDFNPVAKKANTDQKGKDVSKGAGKDGEKTDKLQNFNVRLLLKFHALVNCPRRACPCNLGISSAVLLIMF